MSSANKCKKQSLQHEREEKQASMNDVTEPSFFFISKHVLEHLCESHVTVKFCEELHFT